MGICLLWITIILGSLVFSSGRMPRDVQPVNTLGNKNASTSRLPGVHGIVQVGDDVYITSMNKVYSLKIDANRSGKSRNSLLEVIVWPSTPEKTTLCRQKTQKNDVCNNFIRVFLPKNEDAVEFIVCGTNSILPMCRNYKKNNNSFVKVSEFSGKSICPVDPNHSGASLYTDGNLYSGTVADFLGSKPVIYRYADDNRSKSLETTRDETWLNDPWFIRIVENGPKVLVFFTESAVEDDSGLIYSRVAQICKADQGGEHILRKQFTSFQKARLNCSFPGKPPFYFDELSAVTDFIEVKGESSTFKILFAAMNTPKNSIWGSAVCAFLLEDVENTFNKPFLEKNTDLQGNTYWVKTEKGSINEALKKCSYGEKINGRSFPSSEDLQFIKSHPFKSDAVPSWSGNGLQSLPLFMNLNSEYQFSAITVETEVGYGGSHTVMLIGTTNGRLLKVVPKITDRASSFETSFIFVSDQLVYNQSKCSSQDSTEESHVRNIKLEINSGFILISFANCIVSVPMCPVQSSTCKRTCISHRDPFCAWDGVKCTSVFRTGSLEQDIWNGDVSNFPECGKAVPLPSAETGIIGNKVPTDEPDADKVVKSTKKNSSKAQSVLTTASNINVTVITPARTSGVITPGIIGFVIAVAVMMLCLLIYCVCKRSRQKRGTMVVGKDNTVHISPKKKKKKNNEPSNKKMKNSRKFSDRSGSQKSRSGEELKSSKESPAERKRNHVSESSIGSHKDQVQLNTSNLDSATYKRQVSKESGHSDVMVTNSNEDTFVQMVGQSQSPPGHEFAYHRTYSVDTAPASMMSNNRRGRVLTRNLSLQMPKPDIGMNHHYYTNNTPMSHRKQNPMEIYNMKHHVMESPSVTMPPFHPMYVNTTSPIKNLQDPSRNYQTTSLDRKAVKTRSFANAQLAHPNDVQKQGYMRPESYAAQMKDDKQAPGRKRYQSESSGRHPGLYVMKHPVYSSIEEENLPLIEQHPPNGDMVVTSPQRPTNLNLMNENNLTRYPNPTSPMHETHPIFAKPPHQGIGYTLPAQLHRQSREMSPTKQKPPYFPNHSGNIPEQDYFQHLVQPMPIREEKQSKSNPATPEWDADGNPFFMTNTNSRTSVRDRNPSGKSQGAPPSPVKAPTIVAESKPKILTKQKSMDEPISNVVDAKNIPINNNNLPKTVEKKTSETLK